MTIGLLNRSHRSSMQIGGAKTFAGARAEGFSGGAQLTSSTALEFAAGTSIIICHWAHGAPGAGNDVLLGSYNYGGGAGTGWAFARNGSSTYLQMRSATANSLATNIQSGVSCVAVTNIGAASVRTSSNGGGVSAFAVAYTANAVGNLSYIGTPASGDTQVGLTNAGIIWWARLTRTLSDAELTAWGASPFTQSGGNRWKPPSFVVSDGSLAQLWCAQDDWAGGNGTTTTRGASPITFTGTGAPSKVDMTETLYPISRLTAVDSGVYSSLPSHQTRSAYTRYLLTVAGAEQVGVDIFSDMTTNFSLANSQLGFYLAGTYSGNPNANNTINNSGPCGTQLAPIINALNGGTVSFPITTASHPLDIRSGGQARDVGTVGGSPQGVSVVGIRIPTAATWSPTAVAAPQKRVIFLGDSIAVGFFANNFVTGSMVELVRAGYTNGAVRADAFGSRLLADITGSYQSAAVASVVSGLDGTIKNTVWIQLQTNDYGGQWWSASAYQTGLDSLVVALNTAAAAASVPGFAIILQTAMQRISPSSEAINNKGSTLGDYRTAMAAVVTAHSTYCTLDNGTAIVPNAQMASDGLHLTDTGQTTYGTHVLALLP